MRDGREFDYQRDRHNIPPEAGREAATRADNCGVGEGIEPFKCGTYRRSELIYFYGDGESDGKGYDPRTELYNVANDITETNNLATQNPERTIMMRRHLFNWLKAVDESRGALFRSGGRVLIVEEGMNGQSRQFFPPFQKIDF